MPWIIGGCTDSIPEPSERRSNTFPTKPAAPLDSYSCDDLIGPHWEFGTYVQDRYCHCQVRLASKGLPRARVVQGSRYHWYDIDYDIMTMISYFIPMKARISYRMRPMISFASIQSAPPPPCAAPAAAAALLRRFLVSSALVLLSLSLLALILSA